MATNEKNPTTLDDLAMMIHEGFSGTQRYIDHRLEKVEQLQQDMLEELTATHADVRHVWSTVDMLVHNAAAQDAAINTLTARVQRLEEKIGLTN